MARIRGQIFGDMRGKVGGSVWTRNSSGKIIRARVQPTDARSGAQIDNRGKFAAAVSGWATISNASKAAWNVFALNLFSAKRGSKKSRYSGYQAFSSLNQNLASANRAKVTMAMTTPPAALTFGTMPPFVLAAPSANFNSNIQSSTAVPIQLSLTSAAYVSGTGVLTLNIGMSATQAAAPLFQNPISMADVGLSVSFSNIMKPGAIALQKMATYNVVSSPKPIIGSGWASSAFMVVTFTVAPAYLAGLKLSFFTGAKFYVTLFATGVDGQSSRIGSQLCTAT